MSVSNIEIIEFNAALQRRGIGGALLREIIASSESVCRRADVYMLYTGDSAQISRARSRLGASI
jgi:hypothetical protein